MFWIRAESVIVLVFDVNIFIYLFIYAYIHTYMHVLCFVPSVYFLLLISTPLASHAIPPNLYNIMAGPMVRQLLGGGLRKELESPTAFSLLHRGPV